MAADARHRTEPFTSNALVFAAGVLMSCLSVSRALAQNCKPDIAGEDRTTKQHVEVWSHVLSAPILPSRVIHTPQVSITALVGTYGTVSALTLQVQRQEESTRYEAPQSAFLAEEGNRFFVGLKNGEPLMFTATQVHNETTVSNSTGNLVTTLVLAATISDTDLSAFRDALTNKQIDGVRVLLAHDVLIQQSVGDKNGREMMAKFACFYEALDKKGVDRPAGGTEPTRR